MEKQIITVKGVSFVMMPVEGGIFTMGASSAKDSEARDNEKPPHDVTLNDYYIGETVVTQALWQAVMGGNRVGTGEMPVVWKSWKECQLFINKLNNATGKKFRLPTEAEWEYAAKGGNLSQGYKYAGSDNLDEVAWFDRNSGGRIHPVKQKKPNELGLYDMSGNVWEWCFDYYGDYGSGSRKNPTGPSKGTMRVCRGSSFKYYEQSCRVTCRMGFNVNGADFSTISFRLAMDAGEDAHQVDEQQQQKQPIQQTEQPQAYAPQPSKLVEVPDGDEDPKYHFVKRPKETTSNKKKRNTILVIGGMVVLAIIGVWLFGGGNGEENLEKPNYIVEINLEHGAEIESVEYQMQTPSGPKDGKETTNSFSINRDCQAVLLTVNTKSEGTCDPIELKIEDDTLLLVDGMDNADFSFKDNTAVLTLVSPAWKALDLYTGATMKGYDSIAKLYVSSEIRRECATRAFDMVDSLNRESIMKFQHYFHFKESGDLHNRCDDYLARLMGVEKAQQLLDDFENKLNKVRSMDCTRHDVYDLEKAYELVKDFEGRYQVIENVLGQDHRQKDSLDWFKRTFIPKQKEIFKVIEFDYSEARHYVDRMGTYSSCYSKDQRFAMEQLVQDEEVFEYYYFNRDKIYSKYHGAIYRYIMKEYNKN